MEKFRASILYFAITFMLFSNISPQYHNPQTNNKVDSIIVTYENGDKEKESYNFDEYGKRTLELYEHLEGTIWIKDQQQSFTFDDEERIIKVSGENYEGGILSLSWYRFYKYDTNGNMILDSLNNYRRIYSYNENDNLVIMETYEKTNMSGEWEQSGLWEYVYDLENNLSQYSAKFWDDGEMYWAVIDKFEYDEDGNEIKEERVAFNGTSWANAFRKNDTWDENGNLTHHLYESWDGLNWVNKNQLFRNYNDGLWISQYGEEWESTKWTPTYRFFNSYDQNGNEVMYQRENWDGNDYVNVSKRSYEYNDKNNKNYELNENWNGASWIKDYQLYYSFDDYGNATSFLSESWDSLNWVSSNNHFSFYDSEDNFYVFNASSVEIYYSTLTDVDDDKYIISNFSLSQNYPNPFNPTTTISYSLPRSGFVRLSVYNLLGEEVSILVNEEQIVGAYKVEFNALTLTSGVYFYTLQTSGIVETKKLILVK